MVFGFLSRVRRTPAHAMRVALAGATCVLALAATTSAAFGHAGHHHPPTYGPPAPEWAFPGSPSERVQAAAGASNARGRQAFEAALEAAPHERHGTCDATVEFAGIGDGCRTADGLLRVEVPGQGTITTHGPDFAQGQLDVTAADMPPRMVAAVRHASKADIMCVPTSERHTRLVYAMPADGVDRSATIVPMLRQSAYELSAVIDNESRSLSPTAGRRLRMACDGSGDAIVDVFRLRVTNATSTSQGSDSANFGTIIRDVRAATGAVGGVGTDRLLVYYDAHLGSFSGIGQLYSDAQAGAANANNSGGSVALQDNSTGAEVPSWSTLLHEATHNMGAVSDTAPDTSGNTHCIDGLDIMCYEDGGGLYTETTCLQIQYDCDHDTYFNPAPASGYLTTSWNVAATANGFLGAWSAPADTTAPSAPTNLRTTGGGSFVRVEWDASSDGAGSGVSAYRVYRQTGATWTIVDDSQPGELALDASWSGITASTSYTFRVVAYDRRGNESAAAQVTGSSGTAGAITRTYGGTLAAPTGVHVYENTANAISLAWTPPAGPAGSYFKVKRVAPNGSWQYWYTSDTFFTASGLASGTLYDLIVTTVDSTGRESSPAAITGYTTGGPDSTAPGVPANVRIASSAGSAPTVAWDAVAGASAYLVSIESSPGVWTPVTDTSATSITVEGIQWGATRTIGVSALDNAANASARGTVVFAAPAAPDTQAPTAPTLGSLSKTMTSVTPNWTAGTDNVGITGYRIYITPTSTGIGWLAATASPAATSYTVTGLTPGTAYKVSMYSVDAAGYTTGGGYWNVTTTADTTAPSTITGLTASGQTNTSINLSWNAATDNAGVAGYKVFRQDPGPTWTLLTTTTSTSYSVTGLAAGTSYTFGVRAVDVAGLESASTSSVTSSTTNIVDTTAPSTPGSFAAGTVTGTTAALSWSASTDNIGVTGYRIYRSSPAPAGALVASPTGTSTTLTGLSSGVAYTFTIKAIDAAGNLSTAATVSFTTPDTVAPSAPGSFGSGANSMSTVYLTWNASTDNVGVIGYRVERTAPTYALLTTTTSVFYNATGLSPSTTYTFTVTAMDAAGNESTSTHTVTTPDTQAPTSPSNASTGSITGTSMQVSWTGSTDNVGVTGYRIYKGTQSGWVLVTTVAPGSTTYAATGLASETLHSFDVRAIDAAGNESSPTSGSLASGTTLDITPPTTPVVTTSSRTSTSVTLGWGPSTDTGHPSPINYKVYRNVSGTWTFIANAVYSYQVTGLASSTAYTFGVSSIDSVGNESAITSHATNTLDGNAPTQPGTITPGTVSGTSIALSWGASTDDVSLAGYRVYRTSPAPSGTLLASPTSPSTTLTGLTSGVSYTFAITAVDSSGNESASRSITIATTDVVAPAQPGGFAGTALSQSSVRLTWNAATDNVGVTGYRVLRVVAGVASQVATTTATTYDVTGLSAATTHSFRVEAYDAAGNVSTRASVDVTTPDTSAPSQPGSGAVSSRSDTAISLAWNASTDNVAVTGYRVYRTAPTASGTPIATTSGATTSTVTGLVADTDYTFEVAAIDAAGNESAHAPISGRTLATADTTPPTSVTALTASSITSNSTTLTWNGSTDAGGVAGYRVERWTGSAWNLEYVVPDTSAVLTGLSPATTLLYGIVAIDAAGNGSTRTTVQFRTAALADVTAPSMPGGPLQLSATSSGAVGMSWFAATDDVDVASYRIYRSGDLVATTGATSVTLTDQPVGQLVSYAVSAIDSAGNEGQRLMGSVEVPSPLRGTPDAPAWVTATPTLNSLTLHWAGSSDPTVATWTVRMYRNGVVVDTRVLDSTTTTFGGLLPKTTATFSVAANGDTGTSLSTSVTSTTLADTVKPTRPKLLKAAALAGLKLGVAWGPSRDTYGIRGYELRLVATGTKTRVVKLRPSARAVTVTKLVRGKTYSVSIRAIDTYGNTSAWSNVLRARAR
jgi:fibronectin type 3 domain-containing protein